MYPCAHFSAVEVPFKDLESCLEAVEAISESLRVSFWSSEFHSGFFESHSGALESNSGTYSNS
jgi:hypothetical protein